MHAFLVIGKGEPVDTEITDLIQKLKAKKWEFSLGSIDEVRSLSDFTKLKVSEPIAIVCDIENASQEALNAFLKNLEEPQENLYYVLRSSSIHGVIPTIASRCQIIKVKRADILDKEAHKSIEEFLNSDLSCRLAVVNSIKDRREGILFLENLIAVTHRKLVVNKEKGKIVNIIIKANKAYFALKKNGNTNLHLGIFALTI